MLTSDVFETLGRVLDAAEQTSPVAAVDAVAAELSAALGATEVSFLIADVSGRAVVRLAHIPLTGDGGAGAVPLGARERRHVEETATVLAFDGGPLEQVMRSQSARVLAPSPIPAQDGKSDDGWRVLAPVTERGEAIGLLDVRLPEEPDAEEVRAIARMGHLLAFVVIANRRHTDVFDWGQRTRGFSLSAEIQHRLLPGPRTCEAGAFTLSGWLEPAQDIAGDTFDYSLDRDVLHLSMTDAMGHGVAAALTATLCVGSLRSARRKGLSLLEQAAATNAALMEHLAEEGLEDFVTGLVARLDLPSARLELVNAGHVEPYLVRAGEVSPISVPVDLPFGMFADTVYRGTEIFLEPEDRLLIMTDGMLERNAAGLDLAHVMRQTRSLHPREAVRALADAVLDVTGHGLADDATVLCLDWYGDSDRQRTVDFGANHGRASGPG